jgi:hypothetical protein
MPRAAVIPNNTPNDTKGEVMKKICVGFLSAFFGLAALAAATRAQEVDQLIVNVPYDFVVSGKTLPAGAYRVKRADDRDNHVLAITSLENGGGVLLLSGVVSPTSEEKPALGFEVIGDQHFLNRVETADHIFTIPVPANAAQLVAMKKQTTPSPSSSSGAN